MVIPIPILVHNGALLYVVLEGSLYVRSKVKFVRILHCISKPKVLCRRGVSGDVALVIPVVMLAVSADLECKEARRLKLI